MKTHHSRLASGLLVLATGLAAVLGNQAHAAAYATGGEGQYRSEILWLTWGGGVNGTNGVALANGASTSATIPVTATQSLALTCSLADVSGTITSYRPGNYSGDALDNMYNIGGTGSANQLIAGIMGSGTKSFTVNCSATIGGQPYRIPGLVMADAESMDTGQEYLQGTARGGWNVVEMYSGNGGNYMATKTDETDGRQTIKFGPGGQGSGTSPAAVTFLTFADDAYGADASISMDFEIYGSGNTAIAIGLLAPVADFGDAPATYGDASHVIQALVPAPDGLSVGPPTNINAPGFQLGGLQPPASEYIGSRGPDGEAGSQYSADARGDDNNGSAGSTEEDAWPSDYTLTINQVAQPLTQTIQCMGTGTVAGWIDFDRNGTFDAGERAEAICSGGSAALAWTVPATAQAGTSYVRLRFASDPAQVQLPTGEAADGEVEDHAISIEFEADLAIEKTVNPASASVGDSVTYTLVARNEGPMAADGALIQDPAVPGLDCSAATPQCAVTGGAAVCPAGGVAIGDLQGTGVVIDTFPVGGEVTITLTCEVTASGGP
ncbi:CshA/CshB family fibrillar adhesin-related protein [Luteimonas sp. BDR2-5]|uniref:CshA/CshB family fibrillar adhesin-related protein n=1 Tax=Proluteimonas luteida TaxID=2878685 RepID=UPI001E526D35|nr:CshA/CshB family fibrillar adhesin-related protein [Luteimonas sp. BDR2-5]MCD9027451.1 CshA/CshB family fibrillar adhesin-related protein [Luteimonas sp. BDR2-5]